MHIFAKHRTPGQLGASFFALFCTSLIAPVSPVHADPPPTTVATVPAPPVAGETVRVWYPAEGRLLSNSPQLVLHWGTNGWSGGAFNNTMTKDPSNAFFTDITVPNTATSLNFVFNNGAGTWDNNSGQDWNVAVSNGSGTPPVEEWFFRGTPNNWGTTPMVPIGGGLFEIEQAFNGEQTPARFKIDRFGNWAENYPTADRIVADFATYRIVFDSNSKDITVELLFADDTEPPTVTADPPTGSYLTAQSITLTVTDNDDPDPIIYYTIDGSTPTTSSPVYGGEIILAEDVIAAGPDLRLKTLALDADGNSREQSFFYWIGVPTPRERTDFREETIYFLMTARFFDGDPDNNYYSVADAQAGNPLNDPAWRGDFKGLVEKLDYIKAMGFTAIWITPVVKNRSHYDFHGYHGIDFTRIDPRLESPGYDFQRVIDEVHARDMKIVLDVVLNHSGTWGLEGLKRVEDPVWSNRMNSLFASVYYHDDWLKNWEDYTCQIGTIHGDLPDLDTENPVVQQFLINAYNQYIDMGVDGFRIDTVKHVSRVMFNRRFTPAFRERGGENFFMFAEVATRVHEVWNKGVAPLSTPFYTWQERFTYSEDDTLAAYEGYHQELAMGVNNQPTSANHYLDGNNYRTPDYSMASHLSVIDFPMHWNFSDAWSAFNMRHSDHYYNDATWNVVYVDSHDYGPNTDNRYHGDEWQYAENFSLMFTFRGIPCVYYGSEIMFMRGARADCGPSCPLNTTGRAYFGDHIEGSVTVHDFGVWSNATGEKAVTLDHPLARHIQRLNQIRRAIPALQKGQYSTSDVDGGMAFKRRYTNGPVDSFALVAISGGATFYNIPNGRYVDAVTGDVRMVSNNQLAIQQTGNANVRVYVLDLPGNPAPGRIGEHGRYLNPNGTNVSSVSDWHLLLD